MATQAVTQQRLSAERRFFLVMAATLAICTFAGFAQSYFLMRYMGSPSLSGLVHLHGAMFTAWVLLFGAQASLISARRPDVHALTGAFGIALAVAMIAVGLAVAVTRSQPPRGSPFTREQFLIFPIVSMALFGMFIALAFGNRHRPDHHKRYMLIATINVVFPAFSRMTAFLTFFPRGVVGAMVIANIFLAALVYFDWRSRGKVHPATWWGVGITLVSEPLRILIARSEWWPPVARALVG